MTNPQINVPKLESPLIGEDGQISIPWYRLIIQMFKMAGGNTPLQNSAYLVVNDNGGIDIYSAANAEFIGSLPVVNVPGDPGIAINVGANSPFIYTAPKDGTLVVFGAAVAISRGGGAFVNATLTGGPIPLLIDDVAQITWYGQGPPVVTFLPIGQ